MATSPEKTTDYTGYLPSKIEHYIISHMAELKLDMKAPELVPTCQLWTQSNSTPFFQEMHALVADLDQCYKKIGNFSLKMLPTLGSI
jgi:hypothetical protein